MSTRRLMRNVEPTYEIRIYGEFYTQDKQDEHNWANYKYVAGNHILEEILIPEKDVRQMYNDAKSNGNVGYHAILFQDGQPIAYGDGCNIPMASSPENITLDEVLHCFFNTAFVKSSLYGDGFQYTVYYRAITHGYYGELYSWDELCVENLERKFIGIKACDIDLKHVEYA